MTALHKLGAFDEEGNLRMVVESPKGSTLKLKYEPALGAFRIKRALPLGLAYPFDWGFIPGTRGEDGDPVDALAIHGTGSFPGVIANCRALGMVHVEQSAPTGGRLQNPRLVVTPVWYDLPEELSSKLTVKFREEIEQFFATAGYFAAANPKILGWVGAQEAVAHIKANSLAGG